MEKKQMPPEYREYLQSTDGKLTFLDVKMFYRTETRREVTKILFDKNYKWNTLN